MRNRTWASFFAVRLSAIAFVLVLSSSCKQVQGAAESTASSSFTPRPYQGKLEPDDGQWIRPAKDFASTRYSTLQQINRSNVSQLKLAWSFSTGTLRGLEAAPVVANNTLYLVTPWPNTLYALDLTKPGAPLKWAYDPKPVASSKGVACCDWVNRGSVFGFGNIYFNTLDNYTVAVDANSGKEVWKTKLGDINKGESMTMAPLLVKDKVIVGNSGGEFGIRGWVTALNAKSGKVVWRAYSTGPDSEVLIGSNFKPFYEADRKKDLALSREEGIDAALKANNLDALVFPGVLGAAIAAKAGYPTVIVPFGMVPNAPMPEGFDAKPAPLGVSFTGTACSEPRLIEIAYAFEQATKKRVAPKLD